MFTGRTSFASSATLSCYPSFMYDLCVDICVASTAPKALAGSTDRHCQMTKNQPRIIPYKAADIASVSKAAGIYPAAASGILTLTHAIIFTSIYANTHRQALTYGPTNRQT